jgi:hypothetical protein
VQVGSLQHQHRPLVGHNVIDLLGKTNVRELIQTVYHSFGTISPISFLMHLGYAVPIHSRFRRNTRANIAIGGGREPSHWIQGPNVQFLHTNGMLPCCSDGGCWKSRVVPIGDNSRNDKSLCELPVEMEDGQWVGKCMTLISSDDIVSIIRKYMAFLDYEPRF